jgi:hypothetical protein
MKTLLAFVALTAVLTLAVTGCKSEEKENAKRQANFFNATPPPLSKPGQ